MVVHAQPRLPVLGARGAHCVRPLPQLGLLRARLLLFSLLKALFGEQQISVLGDYIRAALMLRYNGRRVG